jgi:hypothetical protein
LKPDTEAGQSPPDVEVRKALQAEDDQPPREAIEQGGPFGPTALADQTGASELLRAIPAKPAPPQDSGSQATAYSLILNENTVLRPEILLSFLHAHLGEEDKARKQLSEGKGILLRDLNQERAQSAREELSRAGVLTSAVRQMHPLLTEEPLEIRSVQIEGEAVVFTGYSERVRGSVRDVALLNYARTKLSPRSPAYKRCLDIVLNRTAPRHLQIWERTLVGNACQVDGTPLEREGALDRLFEVLSSRVEPGALSSAARRSLDLSKQPPGFDSYSAYENYITFCILARFGEKLA